MKYSEKMLDDINEMFSYEALCCDPSRFSSSYSHIVDVRLDSSLHRCVRRFRPKRIARQHLLTVLTTCLKLYDEMQLQLRQFAKGP